MGIIESVQQYDLNIPAGGAQSIDVAGDRVQFLSALDPFAQIEIRPNFAQGNITLRPGQGFRFSEQVQRWVVYNRGAVALSGFLLIGSGDFFDQRINGDVNVIDGAKSRTLANMAFSGVRNVGAVAGQVGRVSLWNPAGSAIKVIVNQIRLIATAAKGATALMQYTTTPLATDAGTNKSKRSDGVPSVARMQWDTTATQAPSNVSIAQLGAPAAGSDTFKMTEPMILLPGYGLVAYGLEYETQFALQAEWFEESN